MYDRSHIRGIATGTGPDVLTVRLNLPASHGKLMLEAWLSNFGGSNVHLLDGSFDLQGAQSRLGRGGEDVLMTVTGSGPTRRHLPDDVTEVTVYFEGANNSGQYQLCQFRVFDCE